MTSLNIFAIAEQFGDAPALQFDAIKYTFEDLARHCFPWCNYFNRLPQQTPVAITAHNQPATVFAILSAFYCGRTIVLVHPKSTSEDVQRIRGQFDQLTFIAPEDAGKFAEYPDIPSPPAGNEGQCVLFTSGSSTTPKGVVLPESALIAAAKASERNLGWRPGDQWILNLPLAHIGGLSILVRCLLAGKTVILHSSFNEQLVFNAIASEGATLISLVPTTLQRLLKSERAVELKKMRVILLGGAAAPPPLRQQWQTLGLNVLETYGMTETASQVATMPDTHATGLKPLPGITVTIVEGIDNDNIGASLPTGQSGRIRIQGPTVMKGYLNAPPCNSTFTTTDLGHLDTAGRLHIDGRADRIIITGGENVTPAKVEHTLRTLKGVEEAVVFGIPDGEYGQLVAAVLFIAPASFIASELVPQLRHHFPSHSRPRRCHIQTADTLPLLPNGKIDRNRIITEATPRLRPVFEQT